jgi:hypothetical protein
MPKNKILDFGVARFDRLMAATNPEMPDNYHEDTILTIYHGTTKTAAQQIVIAGLMPQVGNFMRSVYPHAKTPAIYAADDYHKRKTFSAIRFLIASKLGKSKNRLTQEDFLLFGAVLVITTDRHKFKQTTKNDRPHRGAEKFDYVSHDLVQPDAVLENDALVAFFGDILGMLHPS